MNYLENNFEIPPLILNYGNISVKNNILLLVNLYTSDREYFTVTKKQYYCQGLIINVMITNGYNYILVSEIRSLITEY